MQAQITTARECRSVLKLSSKLKTFSANFIFLCKGNSHFSVDHITGKLVSNLVINNSPEQAHTWLLADSSSDESSVFHATSVLINDFNICVTLIINIKKKSEDVYSIVFILKLIQQGV